MKPHPSTILATLALFFALAGGGYAARAATGPSMQQFRALRTQVATLHTQVANLQGDVAQLEQPSPTLACLQRSWNNVFGVKSDIYAVNGAVYSSSAPPWFPSAYLLTIDKSNFFKC